ncbi:MAG: FliH/SctL family protein [Bacillota bacterium]
MSRASVALIKKHLAALAGSRPVVVAPPADLMGPGAATESACCPAADAVAPPGHTGSGGAQPAGADLALEAGRGAPGAAVENDVGVLPGGDREAEVARMVEAARAEALRIHREARERGEKEGWESGFAAGQQAAWAQVRQEAEEAMHAALAILEDARRERLVILRQAQQDVVRMALDLAARVLEREVSLSPEVVREQAAALVRRLEQGEKATLHVHPDDVPLIQPWLPELAQACGASLEAVADPAVGRGGVMVETQHGYLDGRLDRQLRRLGEALLTLTSTLPDPGEATEQNAPVLGGQREGQCAPEVGGEGDGQDAG